MSIEDRTRWEQRHRSANALTARSAVVALPSAISTGSRALDLACGQGRHSSELVRKGYHVVAMDISHHALVHTRERAGGKQILPVQADAEAWPFAAAAFDLIVQVDFLDRAAFPLLHDSLRPGGLLLLDTFLFRGRPNAEGPSTAAYLLSPNELPREFAAMEILHYEETDEETARASLLARKR